MRHSVSPPRLFLKAALCCPGSHHFHLPALLAPSRATHEDVTQPGLPGGKTADELIGHPDPVFLSTSSVTEHEQRGKQRTNNTPHSLSVSVYARNVPVSSGVGGLPRGKRNPR